MAIQNLSDITLTPSEVREILDINNDEIISLCKRVSIIPRRNRRGLTYFSYNEVKRLQQAMQMKNAVVSTSSNQIVNKIMTSFNQMEENISNNIIENIDKKLEEKMQDVKSITNDLIKIKTENKKLKQKILELNKENVHMKMELDKFEKICFGLYKKYDVKDYTI